MKVKVSLTLFTLLGCLSRVLTDDSLQQNVELYSIEGKVYAPDNLLGFNHLENWQIHTRILGNGGEFKGFVR